jgi:hypothetical protein
MNERGAETNLRLTKRKGLYDVPPVNTRCIWFARAIAPALDRGIHHFRQPHLHTLQL